MRRLFRLAAVNGVLLLVVIFQAIGSDLESDKRALLDFAAAVRHVRELNWASTDLVCTSWIGIACSNDRSRVYEVHLPGFGLYGPIPVNTIGKLDALRVLSLRSNFLYGNIPSDILSIPSLQFAFLENNYLSGGIPVLFSPRLSMIDLSYNSLIGEIPSSLDLPRLRLLNVSHNALTGSIPISLHKFPVSSFLGNTRLCDPPLAPCSANRNSSTRSVPGVEKASRSHSRRRLLGAIITMAVAGIGVCLLILLFCCLKMKKIRGGHTLIKAKAVNAGKNDNLKSEDFGSGVQGAEKNKLVFFDGCSFSFDLEDLLRASAEVLGKGSYGTSYKAILDEATTVVVKRLKEVGMSKKEFEHQMEIVNKLGRHPNVVPIVAYYFSKDEKLLVCRYMTASSLSAALHGQGALDWESRLNIALGAAKGLAHIHFEDGGKLTHGNIKSSNILLTGNLDACVSDMGLNPTIMMNYTTGKYRIAGYRAPEVIESRKVSQKSDVYSFGVVLLEMLTGKSPIQYSGYEEVVDLPRWVRSVVREEWTAEVFDTELMKFQNIEEEMVQMLQIALSCVAKVADARPSIDEVVRMLEYVKHHELDNRISSEDSNV